jgi:hypothetical protein
MSQSYYVTFVEDLQPPPGQYAQGPVFGMAIVDEPVPEWWTKEKAKGRHFIVLSRQPITPEERARWLKAMAPT